MSKNNHRYKSDYRVEIDNLDDLEELEAPSFEKIKHKKKADVPKKKSVKNFLEED